MERNAPRKQAELWNWHCPSDEEQAKWEDREAKHKEEDTGTPMDLCRNDGRGEFASINMGINELPQMILDLRKHITGSRR
jgi:hypothetical protein